MSETTQSSSFKLDGASLRAYTMIGALALIWLYFHWATGGIFMTPRNLSNLMTQTAVTGVLAVGMLMVILSGNIDLSVGSVIGLLGGVMAVLLTNKGWALAPALLVAIGVGVTIGLIHGVLVTYGNIPAFIVTLGGLLGWRGAIKGLSAGETIPIALPAFKAFGQQYIAKSAGWALAALALVALVVLALNRARAQRKHGLTEMKPADFALGLVIPAVAILAFTYMMNAYAGVPIPVLILLGVAGLGAFITNSTTFGRYLYAIGGNPDAARLSGINIKSYILAVYGLLGALTGVAAVIYTARVGSSSPDAGVLKELDAIAACVIGGASLMGGRGTIFGACIGALIMASLDNGMSLLNVKDFMQDIIKGGILVAAVGLDMIGRNRS